MVQVRIKKSPLTPPEPHGRKRQQGSVDTGRRRSSASDYSTRDCSSIAAENSITDEIGVADSSHSHIRLTTDNSSKRSVRSSESTQRPLTKARVKSFLQDFYEDFGSLHVKSYETWSIFFQEYCSDDFILMRPSGNPVDRDGKARMFANDMKPIQFTLVSIDSVSIIANGQAAIVVFTADQVFDFKGKINEDRAVFSTVIEQRDGEMKIVHEHRTSGKPIPKETRWE